ncbi:unnamed protein product, partial [Didymodactylos carnosus]
NYEYFVSKFGRGVNLPSHKSFSDHFRPFDNALETLFHNKYKQRFDVAFSFPGEVRPIFQEIAETLRNKIAVFYDHYHRAELARINLDLYLQSIYRHETKLIVIFMCKQYNEREWCGLELRAIRNFIKTKQYHRIMLLSVDGTSEIDGIYGLDGHINIKDMKATEVADYIVQRLEQPRKSVDCEEKCENSDRVKNITIQCSNWLTDAVKSTRSLPKSALILLLLIISICYLLVGAGCVVMFFLFLLVF